MNERIQELAEQAFSPINAVATEGVADRYTFDEAWFKLYNQKFAESIIRECAKRSEELGQPEVGQGLKKHFGIE